MGSCASSQYANKGGNFSCDQSTVSIVHLDGKLQQFKEPIKAWHVLSQNPNCFICCSESMYVGSTMTPVAPNQELQLGHIYFLVPRSKSRVPLSLQDLCALTIKADAALALALAHSKATYPILKSSSSSVSQRNSQIHPIPPSVSVGYSQIFSY